MREIASKIDHTLLRPGAVRDEILQVCREARDYCFASVCVNPFWTATVAQALQGSSVKVCTVVGFPLGANLTMTKVAEAHGVLDAGATELDMVQNVGALCDGNRDFVLNDIRAVVTAAHGGGAIVKVILETALLNDDQKRLACQIAQQAGADFVKTSTGFGPGGATAADIELMRATVGPTMGVKASGGIRTLDDALKMIAAGATRIGASASVSIAQSEAGY